MSYGLCYELKTHFDRRVFDWGAADENVLYFIGIFCVEYLSTSA